MILKTWEITSACGLLFFINHFYEEQRERGKIREKERREKSETNKDNKICEIINEKATKKN